ncbi:DNA methyltransferase [Acetobacterium carbinolicum]|uniref:DNA methyltransferase n=1 Tax=Acetobacterium carbinolicum TaxID=52690 RepID=UPI003BF4C209
MLSIFGDSKAFPYPKPESLISRILELCTKPGDLILDSFLGSGTTISVAHKMKRNWIGIEMGEHAYTHCKVRIDKVILGEDACGVTKLMNWKGGGGYRFYELAPSLINQDTFGEYVINKDYNPDMLAAAVALHEGFTYEPSEELFWKQSRGTEKSYLFVTTNHLTDKHLNVIRNDLGEDEFLIISCKSFDNGLDKLYENIIIKKIPEMLLSKCEFGVSDYNLNIIHPPVYDNECEEECGLDE